MVATGLSNKVHLAYPAALLSYIAMLLIGQSPLQGAQSALYAATAPGLRGRGGLFIGPDVSGERARMGRRVLLTCVLLVPGRGCSNAVIPSLRLAACIIQIPPAASGPNARRSTPPTCPTPPSAGRATAPSTTT